jgi:phosphoglycerate dehydrogenase-like enzyme
MAEDSIKVIVAMDFSDEIMTKLRSVSEKLQVERHFPNVPESAYENAMVLYTLKHFPTPAQAPDLQWIQTHFAGVDRVLEHPIIKNGKVKLTSSSGIHTTQIAEYCLTMMLSFMYNVPHMLEFKAQAKWPGDRYDVFEPHGLRGLTLGVAGYGSIGRELARLADALGMTVLATKRDVMHPAEDDDYVEEGTGDVEGDIPERLYPPQALGTMVAECDFVVVTVPLTEETHHMVDAAVLGKMKSSAVLVNIARGGVVDEAALIKTLKDKKIHGAALDVFEQEPLPTDSPLWTLPNVIISPHVSGNTSRYHEKAAALFAENLERYVLNRPLLNVVELEQGY